MKVGDNVRTFIIFENFSLVRVFFFYPLPTSSKAGGKVIKNLFYMLKLYIV